MNFIRYAYFYNIRCPQLVKVIQENVTGESEGDAFYGTPWPKFPEGYADIDLLVKKVE